MTDTNVSRSGSWRATALVLQNQFHAENVLIYNGHTFNITPEFLSYVDTLASRKVKQVMLLDSNSIPCEIEDAKDFFEKLLDKHLTAMNTLSMAWAAIKNDL
jgi:hypothetical protein